MCAQCFVQLYQEIIDVYQKSAVHIKVRFKKFGSQMFFFENEYSFSEKSDIVMVSYYYHNRY